MKRILCFLVFGTLICRTANADIVMVEDFEDGTVNYTTSDGEFTDGTSDYFGRVPVITPNPEAPYTGFIGNGFFAAEDIDDGGNLPFVQTMFFNIDISSFDTLSLDVLFAASGNNAGLPAYDSSAVVGEDDHIIFRAQIDAEPIQNLLAFEAIGSTANQELRQDADFDGVGDAAGLLPTAAATAFNGLLIAGTGNNLLLSIEVASTDGGAEFAFDDIRVKGNFIGVPEPSAIAFLTLAGYIVAIRRRRR